MPTEHCYTLKSLKAIMDEFPDEYLKVYQYIFYMTCPDPDLNPYFNTAEEDKESAILDEIQLSVSLDNETIIRAVKFCTDLYETPTVRMYRGMKTMIDRMAVYLEHTPVTHGRDGNINSLLRAGKDFEAIRKSFKGVYQDLMEEQKRSRGNSGYDPRH